MSSLALVAPATQYRTYFIRSWHEYQRATPSEHHSIQHYNANCEEHAKFYDAHILVLRENVTEITGWYWCTGWPPPKLRGNRWIRGCPHREEILAGRWRELVFQGYHAPMKMSQGIYI